MPIMKYWLDEWLKEIKNWFSGQTRDESLGSVDSLSLDTVKDIQHFAHKPVFLCSSFTCIHLKSLSYVTVSLFCSPRLNLVRAHFTVFNTVWMLSISGFCRTESQTHPDTASLLNGLQTLQRSLPKTWFETRTVCEQKMIYVDHVNATHSLSFVDSLTWFT